MEKEEKNILKDMQDPSFWLLETFRKICPGTFQHSKNVADICESVALELKLDVDLMRVCALYHDVGKINFPNAFTENQNGKNIHNELEPWISYQLITRHISDSLMFLMKVDELPIKILKIISQHHGTYVLRSIAPSKEDVEEYRYKCEKPNTIESAILMIVDSVEATTRSIFSSSEKNNQTIRRELVDKTIKRLVEDGQLDNIKVGELKMITFILYKELDSIYHGREAYEDMKKENEDG